MKIPSKLWCYSGGKANIFHPLFKPSLLNDSGKGFSTQELLIMFRIIGRTIALAVISLNTHAALITGDLNAVPEGTGVPFYWGDGANDLYQEWSSHIANYSGWVYPSAYSSSNSDIYVINGFNDVSLVTDASLFNYETTAPLSAWQGGTVFFRGVNGYYGAWVIDDIFGFIDGNTFPFGYLSGTWYFLDDGSADFSVAPVPVPAAFLLFGSALGLLGWIRNKQS